MPLLEHINEPADLRDLSPTQLDALAQEIRAFLVRHVAETGGHLVDAVLALSPTSRASSASAMPSGLSAISRSRLRPRSVALGVAPAACVKVRSMTHSCIR